VTLEGVVDDPYDSPIRPVLSGDVLAEGRVVGFGWSGAGGDTLSTHLDDRLLVEGDEVRLSPPDRLVPQVVDAAGGVMPPADLPADRVCHADEVDVAIRLRADSLLNLPAAPWQPLARSLLAATHATGHRLWLAGGSVRGLLSGESLRSVNDLDLAGTAPPGRFTDITRQVLRATAMSEFRTTITPDSLVCAVVPVGSRTRMIEYRGLTQSGFRFPAVGTRMSEDVRHRDFSFNALFYDALGHRVIDPCGSGISDLLRVPRRFVPLKEDERPAARAEILVRAAKFFVRWHDKGMDLTPLQEWVSGFPPDFGQKLTSREMRRLSDQYQREVVGSHQRHREFAESLPSPGRELIEKLIGGAA
jgi:hypothetical protein